MIDRKKFILFGLILIAIVQVAVPLTMISRREQALQHGETYRFRAAPVDPYDAFRGRYVRLVIESRSATAADDEILERRQRVYASIVTADDGFATLSTVSATRPAIGAYLKTRVRSTNGNQINLELPFDRYYMNEERAPKAEAAYRQQTGGERNAFIEVRVHRDQAVLTQLFVDDKPIEQYLDETG